MGARLWLATYLRRTSLQPTTFIIPPLRLPPTCIPRPLIPLIRLGFDVLLPLLHLRVRAADGGLDVFVSKCSPTADSDTSSLTEDRPCWAEDDVHLVGRRSGQIKVEGKDIYRKSDRFRRGWVRPGLPARTAEKETRTRRIDARRQERKGNERGSLTRKWRDYSVLNKGGGSTLDAGIGTVRAPRVFFFFFP